MVYAGRSEMRKNYEVIRLIQDAFARVTPQFPICKKHHDYVRMMLSMNSNQNSNIDHEISANIMKCIWKNIESLEKI